MILYDKEDKMGDLLIKIFIKGDDPKDPKTRNAYAKLSGGTGIVTNLILSALKIAIGVVVSSISIIADGTNNLTDASSSVLTLVGFRLAEKPEDSEHPFGHARYEYITGVMISILIIIAGLILLRSSVLKILHPEPTEFSAVMYAILIISILVKLWQCFFYRKIAGIINSLTVSAAAQDSRNDIISTGAVLAGMIVSMLSGIDLDGYLGCGVALFIIISGGQLVIETMSPLLGEAPDPGLVNQIIAMCKRHEGVYGIHDLMVHDYGPGRVFASVHIEVDADSDIMAAHDMVDNIETEVARELGINFVVHMDPVKLHDPQIEDIKIAIAQSLKAIDGCVSFHDVRIVPGPTHTNVVFDVVLAPECSESPGEIERHLSGDLKKLDPKYNTVITFDKAYTHVSDQS